MKYGTLYLWDSDKAYSQRLSKYINSIPSMPFVVEVLTEPPEEVSLGVGDMLLAAELDGAGSIPVTGLCVFLAEGPVSASGTRDPMIFKYQSARRIYEQVLEFYIEATGAQAGYGLSGKVCEIIGVYSPIGRIGKSAYARELALNYIREGPVLLVDLSLFSTLYQSLGILESKGLSDVIYYLKENKQNLIMKLQSCIYHEHKDPTSGYGLDYLLPVTHPSDLREVTDQEWQRLFTAVAQLNTYTHMILDFGPWPEEVGLLLMCKELHVPYIETREALGKLSQFENLLEDAQLSPLKDNIKKIKMKAGYG